MTPEPVAEARSIAPIVCVQNHDDLAYRHQGSPIEAMAADGCAHFRTHSAYRVAIKLRQTIVADDVSFTAARSRPTQPINQRLTCVLAKIMDARSVGSATAYSVDQHCRQPQAALKPASTQ